MVVWMADCYWDNHLNRGLPPVRYSDHHLNTRPFSDRTPLDHLNTRLVRYSDPHCIQIVGIGKKKVNNLGWLPGSGLTWSPVSPVRTFTSFLIFCGTTLPALAASRATLWTFMTATTLRTFSRSLARFGSATWTFLVAAASVRFVTAAATENRFRRERFMHKK